MKRITLTAKRKVKHELAVIFTMPDGTTETVKKGDRILMMDHGDDDEEIEVETKVTGVRMKGDEIRIDTPLGFEIQPYEVLAKLVKSEI